MKRASTSYIAKEDRVILSEKLEMKAYEERQG
jgi:hypothetical protein